MWLIHVDHVHPNYMASHLKDHQMIMMILLPHLCKLHTAWQLGRRQERPQERRRERGVSGRQVEVSHQTADAQLCLRADHARWVQ